ncbi:outer membrane protein transport protein [Paenalcaligenes niemegkensis]|uniref:OmpP1/FadL family transporter n=1 Tax=Paenalcaligenes niemegkensis TaxID=2895469 RepID=UPI001EE92809|nr:outer membrane protein transport protein [Paenalcaligenes niemegkensis]MCQ9617791.1 outer membrane protein transport protein [Paenalcaligenes niemegkensis]
MKQRVSPLRVISAVVIGLGATGAAQGAGFNLLEQNASGLGNAYAGSAAIAENASTIYFNPAGMTRLPGVNVSAGITAIKPSFKFRDSGSTGPGGLPIGSNAGGDAGRWGFLPNAYVSWELTPDWYVGLGIGAPFGLTTKYKSDWMGRYHSTKFGIESINLNPSVAYKVNDQLSIGVGANWMRLDADYRRAVPSLALQDQVPPEAVPGLIGGPDLNARVKMDGDAWGWNAGVLFQATPDTRIGLSYRSTVKIKASGDTTLKGNLPPALGGSPINMGSNARATVKLPDTAILSLVHDLNPKWQLLADVSWTGWSSIKSLDIHNEGALPDDSLDLRFQDAWRVALGANYHYSQQWTFKGGIAWDQTPVRNATYRPTSLPDNDRYWVSVGAQYRFNPRATLDVGYSHLFLSDAKINNGLPEEGKGTVRGKYKDSANIVGVQFSYQF